MSRVCAPFHGKRVTLMGLGLLGRGRGDAAFLAGCGADLTVTDLKTAEELAPTLAELAPYTNISYVLGEHRLADFENRDFILKAAGVPLASPYIAHARAAGVPVVMDASLFLAHAPALRTIGVTGTRGKTTATMLIHAILAEALAGTDEQLFLAGNIRDTAALPLLSAVRAGDSIVFELDSWQLAGFGEAGLSPGIAVFTSFLDDHLNYYGTRERYFVDKAHIFLHQKPTDLLITTAPVARAIEERGLVAPARLLVIEPDDLPHDWTLLLAGEHNRVNAALALAVARERGIPDALSRRVIERFRAVSGRLEPLGSVGGAEVWNDTTATTPDAVAVALAALRARHDRVVLIAGGADKGLPLAPLAHALDQHADRVILLPGSGTDRLLAEWSPARTTLLRTATLAEAWLEARREARRGDGILLSPGFASFGLFKNEYDRGDQFVQLVRVSQAE